MHSDMQIENIPALEAEQKEAAVRLFSEYTDMLAAHDPSVRNYLASRITKTSCCIWIKNTGCPKADFIWHTAAESPPDALPSESCRKRTAR